MTAKEVRGLFNKLNEMNKKLDLILENQAELAFLFGFKMGNLETRLGISEEHFIDKNFEELSPDEEPKIRRTRVGKANSRAQKKRIDQMIKNNEVKNIREIYARLSQEFPRILHSSTIHQYLRNHHQNWWQKNRYKRN